MADKKVLHGKDAIARVERDLGRPLSYAERRVTEEEGYVDEVYTDTKGIKTYGVGQTGEWIDKGFEATFKHHVDRAERRVPGLKNLPDWVQAELIQSEYRGDLGESPTAMGQFNAGKYAEAADEFLNSDEYRNTRYEGIKKRMEKTSSAMRYYGVERDQRTIAKQERSTTS